MLDGVIVERHPVTTGRLLIGRSPQSGLRLDSPYVSRHHAMLLITPHSLEVIDLQSTNRTLVNGTVAERQSLEHGDLLAIGNFRVRYECWSSHPSVKE
jgi:pSer/pThr/pTyr-binding forkhead associated (FHA) protein